MQKSINGLNFVLRTDLRAGLRHCYNLMSSPSTPWLCRSLGCFNLHPVAGPATSLLPQSACWPIAIAAPSRRRQEASVLKHLYLYFQDGQRLALRFPKQSGASGVAHALRKQLSRPSQASKVDGDLLMIPRSVPARSARCQRLPGARPMRQGAEVID